MYNNELYHHGVLGMKWGVRKDRGSSSGKSRKATAAKVASPVSYAAYKGVKKAKKAVKKKYGTAEERHAKAMSSKASARYTYSQRHLLSDAELQRRINRLNMDRQLRDLAEKGVNGRGPYSSPTVRLGRDAMRRGLATYAAKEVSNVILPGSGEVIFGGGKKKGR